MMLVYAMILFAAAVLFLVLGIAIYKGNTKLINYYHQTRVKEADLPAYGRAFAKGMFVICATLLAGGLSALLGGEGPGLTVSLAVMFAGSVISTVVFIMVQKKYNGGVF